MYERRKTFCWTRSTPWWSCNMIGLYSLSTLYEPWIVIYLSVQNRALIPGFGHTPNFGRRRKMFYAIFLLPTLEPSHS